MPGWKSNRGGEDFTEIFTCDTIFWIHVISMVDLTIRGDEDDTTMLAASTWCGPVERNYIKAQAIVEIRCIDANLFFFHC